MPNFYDIFYALGLGVSAPYWLIKPSARRKVFAAFRNRRGHILARTSTRPAIMIHAVSVGEMNSTRTLVNTLRGMLPELEYIISATTDTGFARGQELYAPYNDVTVVRYPLDFSGAIGRTLDAVRPELVVLMELEAWPNFLKHCAEREIPVVLANARLTTSSFRNYRRIRPIARAMFRRIAVICAQDATIGERFLALGVPPHRIIVTGTMKFDSARIGNAPDGAAWLARSVGLAPSIERIWVCGSTGPGEEEIILRVYRKLLARFTRLRLAIVPRHPQRFDEVADLIEDARFRCVRRSNPQLPPGDSPIPPVVLGDTMGELRNFYGIGDVVFVGRSLLDLGPRQRGSDMIEAAALARPVIVGPWTDNFADAMVRFRAADAVSVVNDEAALENAVAAMLSAPAEARAIGLRAQAVVLSEQGATLRHARVIAQILSARRGEGGILPPGAAAGPVLTSAAGPRVTIESIEPISGGS
jgi:3-deoxy-D-manno-octulosonic-acid transferase